MRRSPVGTLRERLLVQTSAPEPVSLASLTAVGVLATATAPAAHGYTDGDYIAIAHAVPTGFNGRVKIAVTSPLAFTYAVASGLASPATGTVTATYVGDAQRGRLETWTTVDTIWGELVPVRAATGIQADAVQRQVTTRFRVRVRADLVAGLRVIWTPTWPSGAASRTLRVVGVLPVEDGRSWVYLDCEGAQ